MAGPTVVLVEGESDAEAVRALAERNGASVDVRAMGGITNLARYAAELAPAHRLVGLYDAAEERFVLGGLARVGLTTAGFHRCDRDLEDELIRALGAERVQEVLAAHGDLEPFRVLQRQPVQRTWTVEDQLHRFFGAGSGRKVRYGRLLVEVLADDEVPAPLAAVLEDALAT
jgi:hypothetical protein